MVDATNIKSQMRKGIDILESLKAADLLVVEGTLYPLLTRLKNNGILTYRWEESPSGPPRKYFGLTPTGKDLLQQLQDEWKAISDSIGRVTTNE